MRNHVATSGGAITTWFRPAAPTTAGNSFPCAEGNPAAIASSLFRATFSPELTLMRPHYGAAGELLFNRRTPSVVGNDVSPVAGPAAVPNSAGRKFPVREPEFGDQLADDHTQRNKPVPHGLNHGANDDRKGENFQRGEGNGFRNHGK